MIKITLTSNNPRTTQIMMIFSSCFLTINFFILFLVVANGNGVYDYIESFALIMVVFSFLVALIYTLLDDEVWEW